MIATTTAGRRAETTLQALPGLLDPTQDGYHDTDPDQPESVWDLDKPPGTAWMWRPRCSYEPCTCDARVTGVLQRPVTAAG